MFSEIEWVQLDIYEGVSVFIENSKGATAVF